MPCRNCPKRSRCREICPRLEAELPQLQETVMHGHICDVESMRELIARRGATWAILGLRPFLEGREREVVDLIFNRTLTMEEAAEALHTRVEVVRKCLQNAYSRMARMLTARTGREARREPRAHS